MHATFYGSAYCEDSLTIVVINEVSCLVANADMNGVADRHRRYALIIIHVALGTELASVDEGNVSKHHHLPCDGTFHYACFTQDIVPSALLHPALHPQFCMEIVVIEVSRQQTGKHSSTNEKHDALTQPKFLRLNQLDEREEERCNKRNIERYLEGIVPQLIEFELVETIQPRLVWTHYRRARSLEKRYEPKGWDKNKKRFPRGSEGHKYCYEQGIDTKRIVEQRSYQRYPSKGYPLLNTFLHRQQLPERQGEKQGCKET